MRQDTEWIYVCGTFLSPNLIWISDWHRKKKSLWLLYLLMLCHHLFTSYL